MTGSERFILYKGALRGVLKFLNGPRETSQLCNKIISNVSPSCFCFRYEVSPAFCKVLKRPKGYKLCLINFILILPNYFFTFFSFYFYERCIKN